MGPLLESCDASHAIKSHIVVFFLERSENRNSIFVIIRDIVDFSIPKTWLLNLLHISQDFTLDINTIEHILFLRIDY